MPSSMKWPQSRFWAAVMVEFSAGWPKAAPEFAAALLDTDRDVPQFLTSSAGINDPRRFAVYRNNVTVGLVNALTANFPSIVRLLGDEFFAAMALEFVRDNPPRSRLMFEYGSSFPDFLETFAPARPYPYLADVARLEILWRQAFHEADAPVISGQDLASVSPETFPALVMRTHPAARILQSAFAAGSIFAANRGDGQQPAINPSAGETVLVTRPVHDCEVRILGAGTGAFFHALLAGQSIEGSAAEAFAANPAFDFSAAIAMLVASGAFTSIKEDE